MFDKLMHPGLILAMKVRDQYHNLKRAVNFLPIKNVLRIITQIYDEKIRMSKDNQVAKDIEMQIFSFNFFLNRFGMCHCFIRESPNKGLRRLRKRNTCSFC